MNQKITLALYYTLTISSDKSLYKKKKQPLRMKFPDFQIYSGRPQKYIGNSCRFHPLTVRGWGLSSQVMVTYQSLHGHEPKSN